MKFRKSVNGNEGQVGRMPKYSPARIIRIKLKIIME